MRDIAGKYVWDATQIYGHVPELSKTSPPVAPLRHRTDTSSVEISPSAVTTNGVNGDNSNAKIDFLAQVSLST